MDNPTDQNAREAAFITLKEILETKGRGDRLTAQEIREATGFDDWESFRPRIRRFFIRKGLLPEAVLNDGYRLLTPSEHVDWAERRRRQAFRREADGLRALDATPLVELNDRDLRRHHFARGLSQVRVNQHLQHETQTRKELGTHTRNRIPLLNNSEDD